MKKNTAPLPIARGSRRRLVVDRGVSTSLSRSWYGRRTGQTYEQKLIDDKARIRRMQSISIADRKRLATDVRDLFAGQSYRLVDEHGRSFGRRLTAAERSATKARVRKVERQEEDDHSRLSRMMSYAHKSHA